MIRKSTKRIETERLILRPFRDSDAQKMFDNWASDPEVTKFLTWPTHASVDVTRAIIGTWIPLTETECNWCIALKESDEPIGSIAVVNVEDDVPEIGYCISRKHWGRGVTPEAAKAVIAYLMNECGAKRVIAKHDVNNPNSGKVMMKAGMHFTGTKEAENNTGRCTVKVYAIDR